MKENLVTIHTVSEIDYRIEDYSYQNLLTPKLDGLDSDFDQNIINEIVLWKVNRYALIKPETLELLNQIKKEDQVLDEELTMKILSKLLGKDHKGIRLAMASTILRFKNPNIYQIIDQRVYRFIFGKNFDYKLSDINGQIEIYLDYLKKLKIGCKDKNVPFSDADRIFYMMDKKWNKDKKLKY